MLWFKRFKLRIAIIYIFTYYIYKLYFQFIPFAIVKRVIFYVPNKVISFNNYVKTIVEMPLKVDKTYTVITKAAGATVGSVSAAKGSLDTLEAIACGDAICAVISGIGLGADVLQICVSFIPGPNVTTVVTLPVSAFCKTFVHLCKNSLLPLGKC